MRSERDVRRLLLRSAVLAFLGVLFEWLNLLGIPDATHQIGATAFFRATAAFEQDITVDDEPIVLLFDDSSLRSMKATWPLSFAKQAQFLRTLEGFDPKAVFYDIAFYQEREGLDVFADAIRETTGVKRENKLPCNRTDPKVPGIPVLLAQPGDHPPLTNLCQAGAQGVLVSWVGDPNTYPIQACDDGKMDCVLSDQPCLKHDGDDTSCPHRMNMAATQLWRAACKSDCGRFDNDTRLFDIVWRVHTDPDQDQFRTAETCMSGWEQFLQAFTPQSNPDRICPQALIVPAASLLYCDDSDKSGSCENRATLRRRIKDHVVIIGAQLPGLKDQIFSPVFGPVPGVYVHAAAFANLAGHNKLLTRRADYFEQAAESFFSLASLRAFLLFFVTLATVQFYLEWVNGLAVPLSETSELVITPLQWFFHRRIIRFHERIEWLRASAYAPGPPHAAVLRNSFTTILLIGGAGVIAVAIALIFSIFMYTVAQQSPVLWVGEAILIVSLSIPEIAATAICAFVSPLLFFAAGRRLLRAFLDPPEEEERHEEIIEDDIVEM
jgi:hypothetical protein